MCRPWTFVTQVVVSPSVGTVVEGLKLEVVAVLQEEGTRMVYLFLYLSPSLDSCSYTAAVHTCIRYVLT